MFEQRRVSPGTMLTLEGASGYSFFVIEEGTVQVERAGRLLETLGPGDFFGEAAILTGERRNASVTAASDANLFVLFGTDLRSPAQVNLTRFESSPARRSLAA